MLRKCLAGQSFIQRFNYATRTLHCFGFTTVCNGESDTWKSYHKFQTEMPLLHHNSLVYVCMNECVIGQRPLKYKRTTHQYTDDYDLAMEIPSLALSYHDKTQTLCNTLARPNIITFTNNEAYNHGNLLPRSVRGTSYSNVVTDTKCWTDVYEYTMYWIGNGWSNSAGLLCGVFKYSFWNAVWCVFWEKCH